MGRLLWGSKGLLVSHLASMSGILSLLSPATDLWFEPLHLSSESHKLVQGQSWKRGGGDGSQRQQENRPGQPPLACPVSSPRLHTCQNCHRWSHTQSPESSNWLHDPSQAWTMLLTDCATGWWMPPGLSLILPKCSTDFFNSRFLSSSGRFHFSLRDYADWILYKKGQCSFPSIVPLS